MWSNPKGVIYERPTQMKPQGFLNLQAKMKSQLGWLSKNFETLNLEESLYLFRKSRKIMERFNRRIKKEKSDRTGGLL